MTRGWRGDEVTKLVVAIARSDQALLEVLLGVLRDCDIARVEDLFRMKERLCQDGTR